VISNANIVEIVNHGTRGISFDKLMYSTNLIENNICLQNLINTLDIEIEIEKEEEG